MSAPIEDAEWKAKVTAECNKLLKLADALDDEPEEARGFGGYPAGVECAIRSIVKRVVEFEGLEGVRKNKSRKNKS